MAAAVMCKIRAWTRQVSKAQIPVDQAVMILRSVVGGLLNYVLTAAPLSNTLMEKIDKLTAASILKVPGWPPGVAQPGHFARPQRAASVPLAR